MYWDITEVKVEEHLTLSVHFIDGLGGKIRFLPEHLTGVFAVLKDPKFFQKVLVDNGVVTWPGELDLAPDAMHEEIRKNGEWVLS